MLDPDLDFFSGAQYPTNKENFGIFLDSMPDTWGKTLMKRRAAQDARAKNEKAKTLYEIDYLLGVYDQSRMGALRFKTDLNGPFLDNDEHSPTPPWSSLGDLQEAVNQLESDDHNETIKKWIPVLIAPGPSLGGARPKANVLDNDKNLWIAKFPSKTDTVDKAAWEYLAYKLALNTGINMAESKIEKISGAYHTFLTRRFDRENSKRIHFASAMTMTGNTDAEYQYTLYYYDQAGNLVQTVPPEGVDVDYKIATPHAQINGARNGVLNVVEDYPVHSKQTKYRYNSLNQLVWQRTPDGGETRFAYDKLGRIIASQNAKQAIETIVGSPTQVLINNGGINWGYNYNIDLNDPNKLLRQGGRFKWLEFRSFV